MSPLLIGGGAAAILALLMMGPSSGGKKTTPGRKRDPYLDPVAILPEQELRAAICSAALNLPAGTILTEPFTASVWSALYPDVSWPVQSDDHPSVLEAEQDLRSQVGAFISDTVGYCEAAVEKGGGIQIELIERPEPQAGYLYQQQQGDVIGGVGPNRVVYRALFNEAREAMIDAGADPVAAEAYAKQLASDSKMLARYRNLMYCALYNDLYYNTYGYDAAKGAPGPNGRRFRSLPQHEDNRTRVLLGLTPMRRMALGTPADKGKGNITASFGKLPYLLMPLLDRDALLNDQLPADVRLRYGTWPDGSSGAYPHPSVRALMSTIGLPSGRYGCTGPGYVSREV